RLRRELPGVVDDVRPSETAWDGVERGIVRHRRRVMVARAGVATVVLAAFGAILWWAATTFTGEKPGPVPATHPPSPRPSATAPPSGEAKGFHPQSIAFFDPQDGLAGGTTPTNCGEGFPCGGAIERTTDSGKTWTVVFRGEQPVTGLSVFGDEAWAVAGGCATSSLCQNAILHSADGGVTWEALGQDFVYSLGFADQNLGWALSTRAQLETQNQPIARTVDGGASWQDIPSPCPADAPVPSSVDFAAPANGWVACVGDAATIQQGKAVFESTDGGVTWRPRAEVLTGASRAGDLSISGHTPRLFFLPDGHGWLWLDRDCLYATTDDGATWTQVGADICKPDLNFVANVQFFTDTDGIGLMQAADVQQLQLIASDDGGVSWSVVRTWQSG
ncbi:MAG TPA: hypothetical protein VKA30_04205, partial [Actinomycetota bacterium]|nr:hypothetical protein [Actinomycetota bacterium]